MVQDNEPDGTVADHASSADQGRFPPSAVVQDVAGQDFPSSTSKTEPMPASSMPGAPTPPPTLEQVFDQVVRMIRETPVTPELDTVTTDQKLRLYGLYKLVREGNLTCGDAATADAPSIFRVQAYAKYQAYKRACDEGLTAQQAMHEYVTLAAGQSNWLGEQCRALLESLSQSSSEGSDGVLTGDTSQSREKSEKVDEEKSFSPSSSRRAGRGSMLSPEPLSFLSGLSSQIAPSLGLAPLVPRGQLDITASDVAFAILRCFTVSAASPSYRAAEGSIREHCLSQLRSSQSCNDDSEPSVVVGLAVRSLLDMYLTSQSYPRGSQIILSPPLTVPGMRHVFEHHGIHLVPVDLPSTASVAVDVEAVERAVTDRTVAIMIVHPFGMRSIDDWSALRALASKHEIHLLEDAAEAYTGNLRTTVAAEADVSFVSFGLIKTATALGGGLAVVRNEELARAMDRIQWGLYTSQSWQGYVVRLLKALLLLVLSTPLVYGCIAQICAFIRCDFDSLVTRVIRSFSNPPTSQEGLKLLRQRPTPALLNLLHRRLLNPNTSIASRRIAECQRLSKMLKRVIPEAIAPFHAERSTCWLYPILSEAPGRLRRELLRLGIDSTQGLAQLQCVDVVDCPRANALMQAILYLPTTALYSEGFLLKLVELIQHPGSMLDRAIDESNFGASRHLRISRILLLCIGVLWATGVSVQSVWNVFAVLVGGTTCIAMFTLSCGALLRWAIGDYYVEKSTCFARFSGSLSNRLQQVSREGCISPSDTFPILDSSPQLKLPVLPARDSQNVLLTGATGFIGSMILRDLLMHREELSIRRIILLCRPKRGIPGSERVRRLLQKPEFNFLSPENRDSIIKVIEGDVAQANVGLSADDLAWLRLDGSVSHIFHCAASVSFTQTLEEAARTNISPVLALQALAAALKRNPPVKLIHISTAFVHGNLTGTDDEPLNESLFPMAEYDVSRIYSSMQGTQFYASRAMNAFGFHNSYTFSKCICEHLLSRSKECGVETLVFRPSIVGPALENPHEGWAGSKPSTLVAAACLYLSYQWNLWSFGDHPVPCIPVDVVSRYVIRKAFAIDQQDRAKVTAGEDDEAYSSDGSFEKIGNVVQRSDEPTTVATTYRIFNLVWNSSAPSKRFFTWIDFAVAVTQLGSVLGFFSRPTALFGLLVTTRLLPTLQLKLEQYKSLHWAFVVCPFRFLQEACSRFGTHGQGLAQLGSFLDLPLLFYPFMNTNFYFESDLFAPEALDGSRYLFSCAGASASFMIKANQSLSSKGLLTPQQSTGGLQFTPIGGVSNPSPPSDIWWACTQPKGGFFVRFGGCILAKVFRAICGEITVDVPSFSEMASELDGCTRLVLAPTHRSLLDFLVLGFVVFSLPELQVEMPMILAADDFERLPIVGFLAKQMNAFFICRGRKTLDHELQGQTECAKCIEVFIEGSRSRDRRFLKPKTGFLRCLCHARERSLVVPVTVNYERTAEQSSFVDEMENNRKSSLSLTGLIQWLLQIWNNKVWLGSVHVSACKPIHVTNNSDVAAVAKEIQAKQASRLFFSDYHVRAIAQLLGIGRQIVHDELVQLGGCKWNSSKIAATRLRIADNQTELVYILLHVAPLLAKAVVSNRPLWARWLHHSVDEDYVVSATKLRAALVRMFDEADRVVASSVTSLRECGYIHPSDNHVLQVAMDQNRTFPVILLRASISLVLHGGETAMPKDSGDDRALHDRQRMLKSGESLGYWGFGDSAFVVQTNSIGVPFVTMKGSRYQICGRRVTKLLPFIEGELKVNVNLSREFMPNASSAFPTCAISQSEIDRLRSEVGEVSLSIDDRIRHGTGHSHRDVYLIRSGRPPRVPDAVVWPLSEAQVERLVSMAAAKSWCLIPFGGGTNVSDALGCPALDKEPRPILSVDLRLMNRVLWIDEENGLARVEAGIVGRTLASELATRGYTMGHEPDSIEFSTLGGWIATKSSGMKRSRYGNIEDIVKSVVVCGASGASQHGNPDASTWGRESVGSSVHDLMFGSEGCLGIVTSAVIRVWPLPEATVHDGILFPNFDAGFAFVREVSRRLEGRLPASLRLLDNAHFRLGQALAPEAESCWINCAKRLGKAALQAVHGLDWTTVVCSTLTYEGDLPTVQAQTKAVSAIAQTHGGIRLGPSAGKSGYEMTFMIAYLRDFALTYHFLGESFETFAPWSKVRAIVRAATDRIEREHSSRRLPGRPFVGCRITQLYHEGVCLYFYLCMSIENVPDPSRTFSELEAAARQEILDQGGSLSHHHGVGKARQNHLPSIDSEPLRSNLKAIKKALDPDNIFGARNGPFVE